MRTIAHLSDLHFGRIDPPVAAALARELQRQRPDLLVVSGDFTQRATNVQYEEAAAFLKLLPQPQLVVPGNHDVPAWNLFRRVFRPLVSYQKYISSDLAPCYQDSELFVIGASTARSFTRTSGWITRAQLKSIEDRVRNLPAGLSKVLVTHHPFVPSPRKPKADILVRGERALKTLENCGIDILLAGHLHLAYHGDVRTYFGTARRSVLSIQAGTATSTRRRNEPNAYNWISVEPNRVTVSVRTWNGTSFEESRITSYHRDHHHWNRVGQDRPDEVNGVSVHV